MSKEELRTRLGSLEERVFLALLERFAAAGVLVVDKAGVDRLNAADPDITFATLSPFAPVVPGKMVATVKIIPFAVSATARDRALAAARAEAPLVRVAPYRLRKIAVISTVLPAGR